MGSVVFKWQTVRAYVLSAILVACMFFMILANAHVDLIEPGMGIELYKMEREGDYLVEDYRGGCHQHCVNPDHKRERENRDSNESSYSNDKDWMH